MEPRRFTSHVFLGHLGRGPTTRSLRGCKLNHHGYEPRTTSPSWADPPTKKPKSFALLRLNMSWRKPNIHRKSWDPFLLFGCKGCRVVYTFSVFCFAFLGTILQVLYLGGYPRPTNRGKSRFIGAYSQVIPP